jgi:hypothetical protein
VQILIVLWVFIITAVSVAPWVVKFHLGINGASHNLWHFTAFLITALFFGTGTHKWYSSLLGCAAAACLAAGLEIVEAASFHSRFEWRDVAVDSVGVAAGLAILIFTKSLSVTASRRS